MRKVKEKLADEADGDWLVERNGMFTCPCGYRVEDDGQCPEGHVSPLKQRGMI